MVLDKKWIFGIVFLFLVLSSVCVFAIEGALQGAVIVVTTEVDGISATNIQKSVTVKNRNEIPIQVEFIPDEDGEKFLDMAEENITLQPNEQGKVNFFVQVKNPGTYVGKINILFTPLEGKEPGVALSSKITVIANSNQEEDDDEDDENDEDEENDDGNDEEDEDGSDLEIEFQENKNQSASIITGGVIGVEESESENKIFIVLGIIAIILVVVLLYLFSLIKEKEGSAKKNKPKKERSKKEVKEIDE